MLNHVQVLLAGNHGVPQGNVLEPVLFLIYINDITNNITSNIRLFADDCTIYRPIKTKEDQVLLQNDPNKLIKWEGKRKLAFNVDCILLLVLLKY
jgi:hypothetical protein